MSLSITNATMKGLLKYGQLTFHVGQRVADNIKSIIEKSKLIFMQNSKTYGNLNKLTRD